MRGFNPKFDADLKFGEQGERWLLWLGSSEAKVEVKTERDKWKKSGNIVFEFFCHRRNKKTGIAATEADFWVQLLSFNNEIVGGYVWPVGKLKEFLRKVHREPEKYRARVVRGGDNKYAEMIVVPISQMYKVYHDGVSSVPAANEKPPAVGTTEGSVNQAS